MTGKASKVTKGADDPLRLPTLYWKQLQELKGACVGARLYRERLHKRLIVLEVLKAVTTSGGIAGWWIWHDLPWLWATIIAAAQIADALRSAFPVAKAHQNAAGLKTALDVIYIDAEDEWEHVHRGLLTGDAIIRRRTRLRKLQQAEERRYFPEGLVMPDDLKQLAKDETEFYFASTFG